MDMLPLERAAKLRQEADVVLSMIHIYDVLRLYGKIFPTGSYFLDLMVYPDIDLYITKVNLEQLFHIAACVARCELVTQVVFEKTVDPVRLPKGLYLKPRVNYGTWGRPWKVDIWSLEEKVILQKMVDMRRFQAKMTPELREQIIRYKLSILTPENRTPKFSGFYIMKAFLDEGISDFERVTQYLIANGIKVETPG